MTKTAYVTVIPCSNLPVKISGTSSYYTTIQSAYSAAAGGNVLQMQDMSFAENLSLMGAAVELQGGFGCDFSANPWFSTVTGSLTVGGTGSIQVENIEVQ
jgi:hypothetical protein